MISLIALLPILPKYNKNNAWGKKGQVKCNIKFRYLGDKDVYTYAELTPKLIERTLVTGMDLYSSSYMGHSNAGIILSCIDGGEHNA